MRVIKKTVQSVPAHFIELRDLLQEYFDVTQYFVHDSDLRVDCIEIPIVKVTRQQMVAMLDSKLRWVSKYAHEGTLTKIYRLPSTNKLIKLFVTVDTIYISKG